MHSRLAEAIALKSSPVAVLLTDDKPDSTPSGVIGFFDISQRDKVDREILSFTMPYRMFLQMESDVEESFLRSEPWRKLRDRQ